MKYSLPTFCDLRQITQDRQSTFEYLALNGVIVPTRSCISCGNIAKLTISRQTYRCTRHDCRRESTCTTGTFFAGHRIGCNQILEIVYFWLSKATHTQIETYTGLSDKTVTSMIRYLQFLLLTLLTKSIWSLAVKASK
jgi:hypothetical protein